MYKPATNHVLVEIDDKDSKWGNKAEDNLGGSVYREGTMLEYGNLIVTNDYPFLPELVNIDSLVGKKVMWNEGHEAGTVFEHEGKKFALIYWWDIVGIKDNA